MLSNDPSKLFGCPQPRPPSTRPSEAPSPQREADQTPHYCTDTLRCSLSMAHCSVASLRMTHRRCSVVFLAPAPYNRFNTEAPASPGQPLKARRPPGLCMSMPTIKIFYGLHPPYEFGIMLCDDTLAMAKMRQVQCFECLTYYMFPRQLLGKWEQIGGRQKSLTRFADMSSIPCLPQAPLTDHHLLTGGIP